MHDSFETDFEAWELLGHVWRHYGNVPRTIDCYRKALVLASCSSSSSHNGADASKSRGGATGSGFGGHGNEDDRVRAVLSSVHINLAGLLDQMDFVGDALVVLHALLDGDDVATFEMENNFAVMAKMMKPLSLLLCFFFCVIW